MSAERRGGGAGAPPARPVGPLDPCVHCGFCLPACPTYIVTADEADSPRGRIVLMRALERGEIGPEDDALVQHLDACLGCRGCEPVCPSGVAYGRGLEQARERLFETRGLPPLARAVLAVFRREQLWRPFFTAGRWLRELRLARALSGTGRLGFSMGMLAATAPRRVTDARAPRSPGVARRERQCASRSLRHLIRRSALQRPEGYPPATARERPR